MNKELKEKLKQLIASYPMNYGQVCKKHGNEHLQAEINAAVPLLSDKFYLNKTKIFWILNDIVNFPKCCICGEKITTNINTLETGYNKYKKWNQQSLQNLACSCDKCRKALKAKHIKDTCLKKYGVENVWKDKNIQAKIKNTNLIRYGVTNGGNTKNGRKKAKITLLKHYGNDGLKSKTIYEKRVQTALKKYGKNSFTQTQQYKDSVKIRNLTKFKDRLINDPEINFKNLDEAFNNLLYKDISTYIFQAHCKKCNSIFNMTLNFNNFYKYGTYSNCQKCHPSYSKSIYENEIANFLKLLDKNIELETNSRKIIAPYELDIFVKNKNIAIEFDGLYWHSYEITNAKNCQLFKTELCEEKGIQLIHVFENEWLYKQDIVKSRIKNLLGVYDKMVFARKCEVREVDSKTSRQFQDKNHIQGAVNAKVNLGLYLSDELVSLMTFGKCRFDKKHEWELLRFCNKLGYHVPGGAGKLLKHFERNWQPTSLVSYADRRWSKGKLYEALGFKLDHKSEPNYWYWKYGKTLESRLKYQKHKLKNIFKNYNDNMSEYELMLLNGYHKIYDCGNLCFVKYY